MYSSVSNRRVLLPKPSMKEDNVLVLDNTPYHTRKLSINKKLNILEDFFHINANLTRLNWCEMK